jgi:hypothetical protein
MGLITDYKKWRPTNNCLTTEQKEDIEERNLNWPSGKEGGRFDSNEGIRSSSFSVFWLGLSLITRGMPLLPDEDTKQNLHNYFLSLGSVLPCRACRENFSKNLIQSGYDPEIHLQSRQAFGRFINHFHNTINVMLKKPTYDYKTERENIENLRAKCTPAKNGNEGSCDRKMNASDKKATCVISILPGKEVDKFKKKYGSAMYVSKSCQRKNKKRSSKKKTRRTSSIRRRKR